jgi:hypothetical protein
LPKAADTHRTYPPFSGKAVVSSADMSATGTDHSTPTTTNPITEYSGPPVWINVSVPSGPPATAK